MTFAIVSNWRDPDGQTDWKELAGLTLPNREAYCARHGYECRVENFAGHFGKIEAVLKNWTAANWLWCLDVDAVITNPERRLDELTAGGGDVILTCDQNGLNSGSILFRTIHAVREILERILANRKSYDVAPWHEQNGFAYQLWMIRDRVRIVEKSAMNSYPSDWRPEHFVLHYPGIPNDVRAKMLRRQVARLEKVGR